MKFIWDDLKNLKLQETRNISFERVVTAIEEDHLITIIENPNPKRYPQQLAMIVEINEYAYCVPFVETEKGDVFLKTVFPSRKYTRLYLNLRGGDHE